MSTETLTNILRKAGELFFKFGIRSISIDDICKALGMSKKTFYAYYSTKDELVEAVLKESIQTMSKHFRMTLNTDNFQCWLHSLAEQVKHDEKDVRHVPQLVFDLQKYYPNLFYNYQKELFELQKKHMAETIRFGQQEGLIRADIEPEESAIFFAKLHSDSLRDFEEFEKNGINLSVYSRNMIKILIRGILTEKGLQAIEN